jgi:hypothetical protein
VYVSGHVTIGAMAFVLCLHRSQRRIIQRIETQEPGP